MKKLVILSLGVLLIAAACNKTNDQTNNTTPPPAATPPATPPPVQSSNEATVSYTSSGFSPNTVTIKKGGKVNFANNSSSPFWPASAPHPSHTDYPGFDPKSAVAAGQSWTFTVDKVGTWAYHDHLNPTRFGKIVVTE